MTKDLVREMLYEKEHKIRNGIYGFVQRGLAYNSNRIEGSTLTEEDTWTLFNTGNLYKNDENVVYRAKDIEEMTGHFAMFNYMLDTYDRELSENIIKEYHKLLKQGVFEDIANGYAIGEYKTRPNIVGSKSMVTSPPQNVKNDINELLKWYDKKNKTLEILAEFHEKYEKIHPFQDGNGRTGRIILFKECLKNEITPFIVMDSNRMKYYKGLEKAHEGNIADLVKYFKEEQSLFIEQMKKFDSLFKTKQQNQELIQ